MPSAGKLRQRLGSEGRVVEGLRPECADVCAARVTPEPCFRPRRLGGPLGFLLWDARGVAMETEAAEVAPQNRKGAAGMHGPLPTTQPRSPTSLRVPPRPERSKEFPRGSLVSGGSGRWIPLRNDPGQVTWCDQGVPAPPTRGSGKILRTGG